MPFAIHDFFPSSMRFFTAKSMHTGMNQTLRSSSTFRLWYSQVPSADLKSHPFPLLDVEAGKCYRLRLIMMASNVENYQFSVAGHNMTLVSLDGVPVEPLQVRDPREYIASNYSFTSLLASAVFPDIPLLCR